jgi:hypothetical protein
MAEQAKKAGDGQGREARIPMRKLTPARSRVISRQWMTAAWWWCGAWSEPGDGFPTI